MEAIYVVAVEVIDLNFILRMNVMSVGFLHYWETGIYTVDV